MELADKFLELVLWIYGWLILGLFIAEVVRFIKKIMKKINNTNENRKRR